MSVYIPWQNSQPFPVLSLKPRSNIPEKKKSQQNPPKGLPSRKLTYPTWGKGRSSSNMPYQGDMLIPWRVSWFIYFTLKKSQWSLKALRHSYNILHSCFFFGGGERNELVIFTWQQVYDESGFRASQKIPRSRLYTGWTGAVNS